MRTKRRWQVGFVCVVLMALLAPAALAVDVCGQRETYIWEEPLPVDIDCETGTVLVFGSTVNLLTGAHVSFNLTTNPGLYSFGDSTINITVIP